ncbi:MAG: hypothetical protein J5993_02375 [Clostridia bacterium]|nr:hypothetical protein [Clostridia bacterium]
MKRCVKVLTGLALFTVFASLFLFPETCANFFLEGISLWAITVLPSVFPFLFLMTTLSAFGATDRFANALAPFFRKVFRVSGTGGGIFVLSALSGYPVGSKLLSDHTGISEKEANKLAPLCSLPSPLFLVGCVGNIFADKNVGFLLWGINLLSVVIVGLLCRREKSGESPPLHAARGTLAESMTGSVLSILSVGAYLALFSVLSGLVTLLPFCPKHPLLRGMIRGAFEMTMGIATLASPTPIAFALTAFLVTFGGACVLLQQATFLAGKVKFLPFLGKKFLQATVAFLLALSIGSYYF